MRATYIFFNRRRSHAVNSAAFQKLIFKCYIWVNIFPLVAFFIPFLLADTFNGVISSWLGFYKAVAGNTYLSSFDWPDEMKEVALDQWESDMLIVLQDCSKICIYN